MTRRDLLDDHFDGFGAQLSAAASGKAPRRSPVRRTWVRPAIGVGGLAALGAGVAAVTLFPVAGGKVDVVSEAKAALADQGAVVHLVLGTTFEQIDGGPGEPVSAADRHEFMRANACFDPDERVALWSVTTGPSRYRVSRNTYRCHAISEFRQVIEPGTPEELGYSGGVFRKYYPKQGLLLDQTEFTGSDENLTALSPTQLGIVDGQDGDDDPFRDPLDRVRRLLDAGDLRDGGRFTGPDGRQLWRLRGTTELVDEASAPGAKTPVAYRGTAEYVVDAKTFAPVSFSTTRRMYRGATPGKAFRNGIVFHRYERLPLTAETEKLLEIQPEPGTKRLTLTSAQIRRIYRGPSHGAATDEAAYAKAKALAAENQKEADAEVEAQIRAEERAAAKSTTP